MSSHSFETTRLIVILFTVYLRILATPRYLQAYLNLAPQRLSRLKREAGKIKAKQLKQLIVGVFYYLCVVALQYLAPIIMILVTALLWKVLGDYSWLSYFYAPISVLPKPSSSTDFTLRSLNEVFTPVMFRGEYALLPYPDG